MSAQAIRSIQDVYDMVRQHEEYRARSLNLIASENVVSVTARRLLMNDFVARYATYGDDPHVRNYTGNRFIAPLEVATLDLAKRLFNAEFVDLRPLGGEIAVKSLFTGLVEPGDVVYESGPTDGGHGVARRMLSASLFQGIFDLRYLPVQGDDLDPDMDRLRDLIRETRPKLIVFGRSRILFPEPIEKIRDVADEVGAYVGYDASHIMGLIAGKAFPNPLDQGADVVAGSTGKTLGAVQGGVIFTRNEDVYKKIRLGFYPSLITNHHFNRIPALAATLLEWLEFGEAQCAQLVGNSQALGKVLSERGFEVIGRERGYSQSHEVLVDISALGDAGVAARALDRANIFVDGVTLPRDTADGGTTNSGLRLGTQELTRTGAKETDMKDVADLIGRVVQEKEQSETVAEDVAIFMTRFRKTHFTFDDGVDPYTAAC
jgi:glycine hydroxymethyltransferase